MTIIYTSDSLDPSGVEVARFDVRSISILPGLQYGVPLRSYTEKMRGMRFEPDGASNLSKERAVLVVSIVDAIARWLDEKFPRDDQTSGV